MKIGSIYQSRKRGVVATAVGMSLILTACGGGGSGSTQPPVLNGPGIVATPSTITITEGASATFDVVLNTEPTADVTLAIASADTSEATTSVADMVFTNSTGATPWNVPQTITVSGIVDNTADGNQNTNVVMGVAATTDTDYSALAPMNVATTVSDIDAAGVTVTGSNLATSENGTTASFDVQLNTIPDGVVQVSIISSDITEGDVSGNTLIFDANNWNIAQVVTVTPAADAIVDGNQTYAIALAVEALATTDTTGYAGVILTPISVTNADIDAAGITVSTNTLNTAEGGASASYSVVLNTMPDALVIINVQSTDITEGTVLPTSLTFSALNWNTPQLVVVNPEDDMMADGSLTYNVTMSVTTADTTGYAGISLLPVSVTNHDNDSAALILSPSTITTYEGGTAGAFTVSLSSQPNEQVTLTFENMDSSESTVTPASFIFDSTNWSSSQLVRVVPVDDAMADGNQSYEVLAIVDPLSTLDTTGYADVATSAVSVTNIDNDTAGVTVSTTTLSTAEAGSSTTYTVSLNTQPDADVVIDVTSGDTTEGTVSPAALTFTATDWSTPQTVTVTPVNDDMADGNQTFGITMATSTVDSTGYAGIAVSSVSVTNADDDTVGVTYSPISVSTIENGAPATFTMVLNTQPGGDVVIDVASLNLNEGTVSPATLTFNSLDWQTPQTVTVTPVDDVVVDGPVSYTVQTTINSAATLDTTGYASITLIGVTVINDDDDTAGFVAEDLTGTPLVYGADLPYAGQVDTTASYYEVANLTAGNEYTVSLTGMSDDADLYVYGDAAMTNILCTSLKLANADESCAAIAPTTSVWVRANGAWATTNGGTNFTLDAAIVVPPATFTHTVSPGFIDYDVQAVMYVEFAVTTGASYTIQWDDAYDGSTIYPGDVVVSAHYGDATVIFANVDSGYTLPQSFTASQTGTVTITLDPTWGLGLIGLQVTSP